MTNWRLGEVEGGPSVIDTNSDSAIAPAVKDPLWITNEMSKELKQANANGLKKATENGKRKVQVVLYTTDCEANC